MILETSVRLPTAAHHQETSEEKKLCLASQRRFTLNVAGKFMFKVSFINTKIRQNV